MDGYHFILTLHLGRIAYNPTWRHWDKLLLVQLHNFEPQLIAISHNRLSLWWFLPLNQNLFSDWNPLHLLMLFKRSNLLYLCIICNRMSLFFAHRYWDIQGNCRFCIYLMLLFFCFCWYFRSNSWLFLAWFYFSQYLSYLLLVLLWLIDLLWAWLRSSF